MENRKKLLDKRPWGSFEIIDFGSNYQVKKIIVLPGKRLSLQSHKHRKEHWVVVKGRAEVEIDDERFCLSEGQYIDIPIHSKHRLSNSDKIDLIITEIQFGSYLEEDDIVRYEDDFGRI